MMRFTSQLFTYTALLVVSFSASSWVNAADDLVIEELVVTATKREQSVQDVPVAINVVDATTVEAMGIDEFTDLPRISPSLTIVQGDWATNSGINLRGIGTNVFSINIEPSVSVIVDDVPVVRSAQAFTDLMEIERIEVLRGPQSTLFGKNASAGVINVVTKAPSDEFESSFNLTLTDDEERSVSASFSGAVSNSLRLRLSGFSKDRDEGHIRNIETGDYLNGSESRGYQFKLMWDATDTFTATLNVSGSNSDVDCCVRPFRVVPRGAGFALGQTDMFLAGLTPSETNDEVRVDEPTLTDSDDSSVSLRLSWDVAEHELLSITSRTEWDYNVATDVDGSAVKLRALLNNGISQGGGFELESISHEFRLISPASDTFEYVLGFFYSDIDFDRDFTRGPSFLLRPPFAGGPLAGIRANWIADTGTESLAVYGQGTWSLTDKTDLIFGIRYNDEEISHSFTNLDASPVMALTGSDSETATPGRVGLQHYFNEDIMVFATYSIGYKGQGYDIASGFNQDRSDNPVASEDSEAFELGMKGTFFDGRLQLNPTIFHATYDDYQAQQALFTPQGLVELRIANVGKLETTGIEIDFQALLSEKFRVVGGIAWVDATIDEFRNANCWAGQTAAQGCVPFLGADGKPVLDADGDPARRVQDLSGEDLANSPDIKLTFSAEYTIPTSMPFDFYFTAGYRWQDSLNFSLLGDPGTEHDSYGVLNLSLSLVEREDERYKVTLFVNNVSEEQYAQQIGNAGSFWLNGPVYWHIYPREANRYTGLRLGMKF